MVSKYRRLLRCTSWSDGSSLIFLSRFRSLSGFMMAWLCRLRQNLFIWQI